MKSTYIKLLLTASILILVVTIISCDNNSELDNRNAAFWEKKYWAGCRNLPGAVVQCGDEGYAIGGNMGKYGTVTKVNKYGEVEWNKGCYSDNPEDEFTIEYMLATDDNGFLVVGGTEGYLYNPWVAKLNDEGEIDWQITGTKGGRIYEVQQIPGGYILAGVMEGVWLMKISSEGTVIWQKTYQSLRYEHFKGTSIYPTSDNGFIITVNGSNFTTGEEPEGDDALQGRLIMKVKDDGAIAWQKVIKLPTYYMGSSVIEDNDGNYVLTGYLYLATMERGDMLVIKLNSEGTIIWKNVVGHEGHQLGKSLIQTTDGGYVIAGESRENGEKSKDIWIVKLNNNGALIWQKSYGGTEEDDAHDIKQTTDGGYIVSGTTYSFDSDPKGLDCEYDISKTWVLKLNPDGTCGNYGVNTDAQVNEAEITEIITELEVHDADIQFITTKIEVIDIAVNVE